MNTVAFISRCRSFRVLLSYLILLCVLCGYSSAQDFRTLKDGVEYAEVTKEVSGKAVNINLLRLDLKKVRLDVHHAMDAAIGTEKTSSIATRHGAFAAINAGFFRLDKSSFAGDPVGIFMINGNPFSEATNRRVVLRVDNRERLTQVAIDHFDTRVWFGLSHSRSFNMISGINRERKDEETIVYTPQFGGTTPAEKSGIELSISKCKIQSKTGNLIRRCKDIKLLEGVGNNPIPEDGFVISVGVGANENKDLFLDGVDVYQKIGKKKGEFFLAYDVFYGKKGIRFDSMTDMIAGVPQLIKNSKIDITWEQEKASKSFVETRHPRTAVAKLKDGKFLMITVDGRTEHSAGIDLYDLAKLLLELGATDAMNLDGGGSTTMFVDGKVVNKPSDKEGERKVSDAILLTLRKPVAMKKN